MANKKLFEDLVLGTPTDTDRFAFGKSGDSYKNITFGDLKSEIVSGGGVFETKTYEIGSWNMDVQSDRWVLSDFTFSDAQVQKIRKISIMILSDEYQQGYSILADFIQGGTVLIGPDTETFSGKIAFLLNRTTSGFFDNASYNSTLINRGWITIDYIP